jgi:hypothetical protein
MVASEDLIQQTIATYQLAAEANRVTGGRHGNLIVIDEWDGDDVMITADLHGNRLNFERLVRTADLEGFSRRHLIMQEVCHGGPSYPATVGCMSHLLLEDVARLKVRYRDRFHFLLGNHELAELVDFPIAKSNRMLNLTFRCGLQEMYGGATERVRDACLQFIQSCPLAVRMSNGVFVCHSAPERVDEEGFDTEIFARPLTRADFAPHGCVFRLVWGRDFRGENAVAFARLVGATVLVHGHEPCPEGVKVPNNVQIILDCCNPSAAYALVPTKGRLTLQDVRTLIHHLS